MPHREKPMCTAKTKQKTKTSLRLLSVNIKHLKIIDCIDVHCKCNHAIKVMASRHHSAAQAKSNEPKWIQSLFIPAAGADAHTRVQENNAQRNTYNDQRKNSYEANEHNIKGKQPLNGLSRSPRIRIMLCFFPDDIPAFSGWFKHHKNPHIQDEHFWKMKSERRHSLFCGIKIIESKFTRDYDQI